MRPSTLAAVLLFAPIALLPAASSAQKPAPAPRPHARPQATRAAQPAAEPTAAFPVTSVSLYKNGVGFFEHTGRVTGNAAVSIDFTSSQLNDVLQSLTAIDLHGGRIAGADYNSTTPLAEQLKSLSLGLPASTTYTGFLTALRGARVEVRGSGAPFTGRLMDIEMHKTGPGKDGSGTVETRFLSVVSASGELRIFPLTPTLSVRLLDAPLDAGVNHYLQLLDATRNQGLRRLTLEDRGAGTRELRVSYISEVPIWKSTYRILFTDAPASTTAQTATLQGWSIVDNTTGADWINVHLSLIAGAPQSFIQPLSVPYYSRRPEVPLPQQAQLTPQTYESGIAGGIPAGIPPKLPEAGIPSSSAQMGATIENLPVDSRDNITMAALLPGVTDTQARSYELNAANSLEANATTAAFDDFFQYKIAQPITILKNESAMVPILQAKVDAERVTLVSSNGRRIAQPLRALWLTNTTGLTLDRGSFSIIENGNFGGEGLLDPIHAGEKRLLSYAADQAVHVSIENVSSSSKVVRVTAGKGVLVLHEAQVRAVTYVIHNAAAGRRTIVLEHPVVRGYKLDSQPAPDETTPSVYRFRVSAAPGETVRLHVSATHHGASRYQLAHSGEDDLALIVKSSGGDATVQAALAPILDARRRVADAQTAVDRSKAALAGLRSDEDRERSNITAVQNADKDSRARFVQELNRTEDQIASAEKDLETRTAALDAAKADLSNLIENLQLDETLPS